MSIHIDDSVLFVLWVCGFAVCLFGMVRAMFGLMGAKDEHESSNWVIRMVVCMVGVALYAACMFL